MTNTEENYGLSRLQYIETTLEDLLCISYSGEANQPTRSALSAHYIRNELSSFFSKPEISLTAEDCSDMLSGLAPSQWDDLEVNCFFYASEELASYLVGRQLKYSDLLKEEACLYIHDHLYRNDFKRIRRYDKNSSAKFSTYMWRVISNLIIDFSRKKSLETELVDTNIDFEDVLASTEEQESQASVLDELNLQRLVETILETDENDSQMPERNSARRRLRECLELTAKERVFLRALCQSNLNINQVRMVPGFKMEKNEAYQFYQNIFNRIARAFKQAGIYHEWQKILMGDIEKIDVIYSGNKITTPVTEVFYIKQETQDKTSCCAKPRGRPEEGIIEASYKTLKKRFEQYFTSIQADVMVANLYVEDVFEKHTEKESTYVRLRYLNREFQVGTRYQKNIQTIGQNVQ